MRHAFYKIESRMLESHTYNSRDYYISLVSPNPTPQNPGWRPRTPGRNSQQPAPSGRHNCFIPARREEIIECIETLLQRADSAHLDAAELQALGKRVLAILKQHDDPQQRQRAAKARTQ